MLFFLWSITRCCCRGATPDAVCHGGYGGTSSPYAHLSKVDGYYSTSDSWKALADLPFPGRHAHGGAVAGELGYAVGGTSPVGELSDNDEYNPSTDSWSGRAPLPTPTRLFLSTVGIAGDLYAFGGFHFAGGANGYLDYVQNDAYVPTGDSWSSKTDLPSPSRRAAAYAAVSGKAYSWGGFDGDTTQFGGAAIRDNDEYDPAGNNWTSRTDTPIPARYKIQGGASVDGKGYLLGGAESEFSGQQTGIDDCDEYDPSVDSWTSKTDSGLNRALNTVTQTKDGLIHAFAGSHQTTFVSQSHQCYDPATDSWLARASIPTPPRADSAAFGL